jgi:hypothetical protein
MKSGLLMVEPEVPTMVVMKNSIFWYKMPRSLWKVNWPLEEYVTSVFMMEE